MMAATHDNKKAFMAVFHKEIAAYSAGVAAG